MRFSVILFNKNIASDQVIHNGIQIHWQLIKNHVYLDDYHEIKKLHQTQFFFKVNCD